MNAEQQLMMQREIAKEKERIRKQNIFPVHPLLDEEGDIYTDNGLDEQVESDEISTAEEAFMRGWQNAGII